MRITAIYDSVESIASDIQNAYINFSKMTCSVVAVVTDQIIDGKPIVGYGFNSNGRYNASGILKDRLIPRLLEGDPDHLVDADGYLDPHRAWDVMMTNEKPGGHGERSVAVGVLDMALWDARAKMQGVPLYQLLANRAGRKPDSKVWVYAAGGYYYPGKDISGLQDEFRQYLDLGYTVCKMKIGAADLSHDCDRIEAALKIVGEGNLCVDANGGVWVAAYNAGCILRFTPEGNPDRKIDIPAKKVTSLCFGDEDLRTLYVTSADNQTDEKRGGCVFRLRVDVAGLPHARVLI